MSAPLTNETFESWFERQEFRNFRSDEFTDYFRVNRRGVQNSPPPRSMWENVVPTLRIVDNLRDHFGRAIVVISSYRSPVYNAAIAGAADKSFHLKFMALDIVVAAHSPQKVFDTLKGWRSEGRFKGGLGLYSSFVHIDTRGNNATW